jgi:Icc-related predicted phosphoesterase
MKIVCLSDTHGRHRLIDLNPYPADTIIFAGDWTKGHDIGLSETADFLYWLDSTPYTNKIFIAGNHEVAIEQDPEGFDELLLMYPDLTYLHNSSITIDGINFYGSPYSNEFNGWAFMGSENKLKHIWNQIPLNTNILITHGPAYDVLDTVNTPTSNRLPLGSISLTKRKQELLDLSIHICGHIHSSNGMQDKDNVTNINASVLNEDYRLVYKPIIIDTKDIHDNYRNREGTE